jgi:hypothetical protein
MRPVVLHDLLRAAQVLREAKEPRARRRRLHALFRAADRATAEPSHTGFPGDGTLAGACAGYGASGPAGLDDGEFCLCLAMVLRALAHRLSASGCA